MKTVGAALLSLAIGVPVAAQSAIEVAEVARTIGRSSAPFSEVTDMAAVSSDLIVVVDSRTPALWTWDPNTGSVQRFAREGDGPGEVRLPVQVARRPEGGVAVYDVGRAAMILFSAALEYEAMFQVGVLSNAKDLMALDDGSFVIAGGRLSNPRHLYRFSAEGEQIESWGPPDPELEDMAQIQIAGGALRRGVEGSWLFAPAAPYEVLRFPGPDLDGGEVLVRDHDLVPPPTQEELVKERNGFKGFQWWHDRTSGLTHLSGGRLLTVVTRFYSSDSVWSVHEADGTLAARAAVPTAYYLFGKMDETSVLASYRDPDTDEHIAVVLEVSPAG